MTLTALIVAALTVSAIATTDASPHEARLLLRIAELEGQWRPEVARCEIFGKLGERGSWQVLASDAAEARELCASFEGAARIALQRVRESMRACAHLPEADRLSAYTTGRCISPQRESRARWVP